MSKIMGAIWEFREKGITLLAGDRGAEATMQNQFEDQNNFFCKVRRFLRFP